MDFFTFESRPTDSTLDAQDRCATTSATLAESMGETPEATRIRQCVLAQEFARYTLQLRRFKTHVTTKFHDVRERFAFISLPLVQPTKQTLRRVSSVRNPQHVHLDSRSRFQVSARGWMAKHVWYAWCVC